MFLVLALLAVSAVPAMAMMPKAQTEIQPEMPPDINSIVDVALAVNAQTGEFSILIQALLAADPSVIQTLDGKGQFTVFAPTDQAFLDLLNELGLTPGELLGDQELVTQVLLYHVLHGRRYADDILASERLRTLQRGFLFQSGGVLTDANDRTSNIIVGLTDIEADNGIIHVIDRVVLP
jgi:uncharacterized surface protein with fasciclin (FAS1) repeats